jgi:hypothetical protein
MTRVSLDRRGFLSLSGGAAAATLLGGSGSQTAGAKTRIVLVRQREMLKADSKMNNPILHAMLNKTVAVVINIPFLFGLDDPLHAVGEGDGVEEVAVASPRGRGLVVGNGMGRPLRGMIIRFRERKYRGPVFKADRFPADACGRFLAVVGRRTEGLHHHRIRRPFTAIAGNVARPQNLAEPEVVIAE